MWGHRKVLVPVILGCQTWYFHGLSRVEFPWDSRNVRRHKGALAPLETSLLSVCFLNPGYELPMARESHTNTAENPLG